MKRFYKEVSLAEQAGGWQVLLDGRAIKTQAGKTQGENPQILPTKQLAQILAAEWEAQDEELDPASFPARDMADYALDVIAPDKAAAAARIAPYGETDTLCYRAEPDEPLFARQEEVWEPLLQGFEARESVAMVRVSGIIHAAQNPQTLAKFAQKMASLDAFQLAALETLSALATSLSIGFMALDDDADIARLWDAANLEEDWQAELWGTDEEAAARTAKRRSDFIAAIDFAKAARS